MIEPRGIIDRSPRTRLLAAGPDRAKLLHNLTTQDVLGLAPGQGREAFVTSPQGKTLAWTTIHNLGDALLLRGDPGAAEAMLPHFQKYGLFDDVTWTDRQGATCERHVLGPWRAPVELDDLACASTEVAGVPVLLIHEAPAGVAGWTIIADAADAPALDQALAREGLVPVSEEVFESWRIEAGTPKGGLDITPENLPQEFERDARAISFQKGCYLGQETVARLDALGHVNRVLRRCRIEGAAVPPAGTPVMADDGKVVGKLTSTALSPRLGHGIGLAMVRTKHAESGTVLKTAEGTNVNVLGIRGAV